MVISDDIISDTVLSCGMVISAPVSKVKVHACGHPAKKTARKKEITY